MSLKAIRFTCVMAVMGVAGCTQTPPVPPPTVTTAAVEAPHTTGNAALLTATARVVSVDHTNRVVRLRGPKGRTFTVDVGPEVKNFDQIRPGDTVTVQYYKSIAFTLGKPGAPTPADTASTGLATAEPGALPAGLVARRITVTGLVTGIDMDAHTLTLVDPKGGGLQTIHVTDPQRQQDMQAVKVGDTITATITQALAISVERVTPARGKHRS